ncbi:uncharacterized protein LOC113751962 [Coffea eugenioides]|uniref:uncharacterized protein LOC113751962 n=1 Tax=Coffea eugenioides TaxID=49369 RepID=UPI000F60B67D|nr:uncharacterized protein LOC113751962 [Coffea eugenioides]
MANVQSWALSFLSQKGQLQLADHITSWLPNQLLRLSSKEMELVGVILWNLWNNRNGAIFDGPYRDLLNLISLSIAFLNQFHEANSKDKCNTPISLQSRLSIGHWIRPNAGFVMANFDGAVFMDDKSSGVGVIIRDDKGSFIAGLSKKIPGIFGTRNG